MFLLALRNVTQTQEGLAVLAEKTKLNRESVNRILSARGNPEHRSLTPLLPAPAFWLAVSVNR